MSSLKQKFLSGALSVLTILSLFTGIAPTQEVYAANDLANVKIYAEKTQSEISKSSAASLTKVVDTSVQQWDIELWHYSGGYWGGNISQKIYDKDWATTAGGTADLKAALTLTPQTFTYNIAPGSDLEKAIQEGNDVFVNISSGSKGFKLSSFYEISQYKDPTTQEWKMQTNDDGTLLATDATAKIVKENGKFAIKVTIKPQLNYYTEKDLSYKLTYDITLNKWVPFVQNGFGYQVYSIFGGGFNAGYALGWVNQSNPLSMEGMPAGRIHPTMISSPDGHLNSGYEINVNGKTAKSSDIRIGDYTFRNAGAVGLRFCFPISVDVYVTGSSGKVVTSYVKLKSVNADGIPEYEQIKVETSDAELDEKGAVKVDDVKALEEGTGYLNDVFTSPKDLSGEATSLVWTSDLPSTPKEKITATADDIWSYNLSIRTGILKEIENLTATTSAEYQEIFQLRQRYVKILQDMVKPGISFSERNKLYLELNRIFSRIVELAGISSQINKENSQLLNYMQINNIVELKIESDKILSSSVFIEDIGKVYLYSLKERPTAVSSSYTVANKLASPSTETQNPGNNTTTTISGVGADTDQLTTLYLRYVVIPERQVRHIIKVYKNGVYASTEIRTEKLPVQEDDGGYSSTVNIPQLDDEDIEFVSWATSKELPLTETMPSKSIKTGTTLDPISDMDADENLYVEWKKNINSSTVVEDTRFLVEQWRLSKYTANIGWLNKAYMNLNLTTDRGHARSTLSPSSGYSYKTINPNGKLTSQSYDPQNYYFSDYLLSKALTQGSYSVTHSSPSATVDMTGNLDLVKGSNTFGLKTASWLTSADTQKGLALHNIQTASQPTTYKGESTVKNSDLLQYGIVNSNTYSHNYGVYYHYTCHHSKHDGCHDVCACYTLPETRSPNSSAITYLTADYRINSTFDRYLAQISEKLIVKPVVSVTNGKTTVAYQSNTELNVYPEVAMLFDNSQGESSIKWVIGEQARKIKPIIYHTLQFKVWVAEQSNATAFATDSRASQKAASMGESNKQVAYKGTSINTAFNIHRNSTSNNTGILTVKTYALDLISNKNGVNLKQVWGATGYDVKAIHNSFVNKWNFTGIASENLEIASTPLYTGATKTASVSLKKMEYSNGSVTEFTHGIIVRGGVVVGVNLYDKTAEKSVLIPISQLKEKDENLYEALEAMHLIGSKADTVFKGFEHQTGAQLTEEKYITLANAAKKSADGFDTKNLALNKGWYSEDSTVLVVKEYITNYEVPSIAFTDKISLTVKGLETPIDKTAFFSTMVTGHTFIKYNFLSSNLGEGLGTTSVYFEHSSRTGSAFGNKQTDYLVPNVSVIDTTRVS